MRHLRSGQQLAQGGVGLALTPLLPVGLLGRIGPVNPENQEGADVRQEDEQRTESELNHAGPWIGILFEKART